MSGRRRGRRRTRGRASWARRAIIAVSVAGGLVVALVVAGVVGVAIAASKPLPQASVQPEIPACPAADPVDVGGITVPRGPIAGYCQAELVNAAHIILAARSLGIGTHTQAVGVMTAIGETHLRNLDYGDSAGPDSRGLFQQRDNGAWGTLAERMDPYTAALHFFQKAITVPGWQTMAPTLLAHAVQHNADAGYYAQYWSQAEQIVAALNQ